MKIGKSGSPRVFSLNSPLVFCFVRTGALGDQSNTGNAEAASALQSLAGQAAEAQGAWFSCAWILPHPQGGPMSPGTKPAPNSCSGKTGISGARAGPSLGIWFLGLLATARGLVLSPYQYRTRKLISKYMTFINRGSDFPRKTKGLRGDQEPH